MGAVINLEVQTDLPEGWTPLDMVCVVQCLDTESKPQLCVRATHGLLPWNATGMLVTALETVKGTTQSWFEDTEGGEDG